MTQMNSLLVVQLPHDSRVRSRFLIILRQLRGTEVPKHGMSILGPLATHVVLGVGSRLAVCS